MLSHAIVRRIFFTIFTCCPTLSWKGFLYLHCERDVPICYFFYMHYLHELYAICIFHFLMYTYVSILYIFFFLSASRRHQVAEHCTSHPFILYILVVLPRFRDVPGPILRQGVRRTRAGGATHVPVLLRDLYNKLKSGGLHFDFTYHQNNVQLLESQVKGSSSLIFFTHLC